eukprot:2472752-Prymnesium_polylepis.2
MQGSMLLFELRWFESAARPTLAFRAVVSSGAVSKAVVTGIRSTPARAPAFLRRAFVGLCGGRCMPPKARSHVEGIDCAVHATSYALNGVATGAVIGRGASMRPIVSGRTDRTLRRARR